MIARGIAGKPRIASVPQVLPPQSVDVHRDAPGRCVRCRGLRRGVVRWFAGSARPIWRPLPVEQQRCALIAGHQGDVSGLTDELGDVVFRQPLIRQVGEVADLAERKVRAAKTTIRIGIQTPYWNPMWTWMGSGAMYAKNRVRRPTGRSYPMRRHPSRTCSTAVGAARRTRRRRRSAWAWIASEYPARNASESITSRVCDGPLSGRVVFRVLSARDQTARTAFAVRLVRHLLQTERLIGPFRSQRRRKGRDGRREPLSAA